MNYHTHIYIYIIFLFRICRVSVTRYVTRVNTQTVSDLQIHRKLPDVHHPVSLSLNNGDVSTEASCLILET